MSVEHVLEEIESAERGELHARACRGLRIHVVRLLIREVTAAGMELAAATNEYEAELAAALESDSRCCSEALKVRGRLKVLRQQQQWSKAAHLAELVSILLYEAMGGLPVSADTAGISLGERERMMIQWLAARGHAIRLGGGGPPLGEI